jgi:hypothetical protein
MAQAFPMAQVKWLKQFGNAQVDQRAELESMLGAAWGTLRAGGLLGVLADEQAIVVLTVGMSPILLLLLVLLLVPSLVLLLLLLLVPFL